MYRVAGQKVVARFDPDDLPAGIEVYDLEGRWLGHAACLERGGFRSVEDARTHARRRAAFQRAVKDQAAAERRLTAAEIAARLRATGELPPEASLPEAEVVRLPQPDRRAPKPPRPSPDQEAAEARAQAGIARLADHRPERAEDGDPRSRFARAQELEAILAAGGTLTEAQSAWLGEYRQSAEYRGFAAMHAAINRDT